VRITYNRTPRVHFSTAGKPERWPSGAGADAYDLWCGFYHLPEPR
jgi:hypothetical protein